MTLWAEREARRIDKARALIRDGVPAASGTWADAGCGDGVFTAALHTLLQPGSVIYAVDRSRAAIDALTRHFADSFPGASLHPVLADFTRPLDLPSLNGLIMANAIHFVRDKLPVLRRLTSGLVSGGRFIVVEYNTARGNPAVPYPIDENAFLALAGLAGLRGPRILARIPSTFLGEMYAGMALTP